MMDWDKLKGIIDIKILDKLKSGALKLNLVTVNNIHNTTENNNYFFLNLSNLSNESQRQVSEFIFDNFSQKEIGFLKQKDYSNLNNFKLAINTSEGLISFFRNKIPNEDLEILGYAVYCKWLYKNNKESEAIAIKTQSIEKFGERARNIINIFTSGYFESTIKPLCEVLTDQNGFDKELFSEIYEIIVGELIFTFFVSSHTDYSDDLIRLKERIQKNKKYGSYKINIHGINDENIKKINKLISEIDDDIEGAPTVITDSRAILVKICLKKNNFSDKTNLPSTRVQSLVDLIG